MTSFVGRERELTEVTERLLGAPSGPRLLTLTGAGGCGKTRLALQVASNLVDHYRDGVWLVELAALADPDLVPATVTTPLGVREGPGQSSQAALLAFLRPRRLLLVLDNCEHVIDACARLVDAILQWCPQVQILATSREALGITGEVSWRVPSLAVPSADQSTSLTDLTTNEAIRLFVDRASDVQVDFALTERNGPVIAQICRRLDGIPLAIELAATRVTVLSVNQIAGRLDQRFRLLTGGSRAALPRQQTLAALVGWSYDLLSERERAVFNRLSVFAGGFTLEAVEAVCGDFSQPLDLASPHPDTFDLLSGLVDKSLVIADGGAGSVARYDLLETLRQYGRDRLVEASEAPTLRDRHRDWCVALTAQAEPHLWGSPEEKSWLTALEIEQDNLRTALSWCLETNPDAGLDLAAQLAQFWGERYHLTEGRGWLEQFLARSSVSSTTRAYALLGLGQILTNQGNLAEGLPLEDESVALFRAVADKMGLARALRQRGHFLHYYGDLGRATADLTEALALARETDTKSTMSIAFFSLTSVELAVGNVARAKGLATESLVLARASGSGSRMGWSFYQMGRVAYAEGNFTQARIQFLESLAQFREIGSAAAGRALTHLSRVAGRLGDEAEARDFLRQALKIQQDSGVNPGVAACLCAAGVQAVRRNAFQRGARLFGAAEGLAKEMILRFDPEEISEYLAGLADSRTALGDEEFARGHAEGQAMTQEQAIDYAKSEDDP